MKHIVLKMSVLAGLLVSSHAMAAGMEIDKIYAYETKASMPAAAVFMEVENETGTPDRLVDVQFAGAERVELHTMAMEGEVMKMRRVDGYDVPADGDLELSPQGHHVMAFGLKTDLNVGDRPEITLVFEKAGPIQTTLEVIQRGTEPTEHDDHDGAEHGHHTH